VDKVLSVYLRSGRMPHVTDSQNHCDEGSDGAAIASRDKAGRDCRHIGFPHVHGTRAAYVSDRCGCTLCRAANRAAEQHRTTAKRLSRWEPYVDAEPTRVHLLLLRKHGLGIDRIAQLSGIPRGRLFDDC